MALSWRTLNYFYLYKQVFFLFVCLFLESTRFLYLFLAHEMWQGNGLIQHSVKEVSRHFDGLV